MNPATANSTSARETTNGFRYHQANALGICHRMGDRVRNICDPELGDSFVIHNVDCFEYMRSVPDGTFDMILTDPPYGTTSNKWDKAPELEKLWSELKRVGKPGCVFVITAQQPFAADMIAANRKQFRHELIWSKNRAAGFLNAKVAPLRAHENILVFCQVRPTYNPQMTVAKKLYVEIGKRAHTGSSCVSANYGNSRGRAPYNETGLRYPQSIMHFSIPENRKKNGHPTQKPLDLFQWLVRTYSNPGAKVFDPYSGSGTTAHACLLEGREYEACELDAGFYELSQKRIADAQSQLELSLGHESKP